MKLTYEEIVIAILQREDRPMKSKELISMLQDMKPTASNGTLRQIIYVARIKQVICLVKMDGFRGFYCIPQWFNGTFLKDPYKEKIYASKQVQI